MIFMTFTELEKIMTALYPFEKKTKKNEKSTGRNFF